MLPHLFKSISLFFLFFLSVEFSAAQTAKTREVVIPLKPTDLGYGMGRYTLTLKPTRKWMARPHVPLRLEPRTKGRVGAIKYSRTPHYYRY
jgi:hypothetical protein